MLKLVLLFAVFLPFVISGDVAVSTVLGAVKGYEFKSARGRNVYGFKGIPFAQPPVGRLRYKHPEPISPWGNDTIIATEFKESCIQKLTLGPEGDAATDGIFGSEDCLYLNVFTPKVGNEHKLPVLFFIHGGSFVIGGASGYGTDKLMDHDIVVVTINYRLGPFGFLSTEDEILPSNLGMWDQVVALKWVRSNIKNFGGDPDLVTLSGSSAGAASALYHMFSPQSTGLFHRIIAQSGTPFCPWAFHEEAPKFTMQLAKDLGCDITTSNRILDCLKEQKAADVIKASSKYVYGEFYPILYGPTLEKKGPKRFLYENPLVSIENKDIENKVPVMTGVTSDEGIFVYNRLARDHTINANFFDNKLAELLRNTTVLPGDLESAARIVRNLYAGGLNFNDQEAVVNVTSELLGDIYIYSGNHLALTLLSQRGIPTYSYVFDYRSDFGFMDLFEPPRGGVSHVDDLFYIYEYNLVKYELKEQDKVLSEKFIKKIVEFMKDGTVSEWPAFKPELPGYLHIHNEKMEVDVGFRNEQADLWNNILPQLSKLSVLEREEL